ncbi:hypothetical protein EC973_007262 [Apophysomyces ossiformis]|uniref:F-box domain-containing protein n=1 Tax=Apophysomyces ossiformis TaxID=679940 RepID=A0A8H7BVC6_9FUNG|nr:hypothetical protein EC973_007262 [Apophysomyces ossiformis]
MALFVVAASTPSRLFSYLTPNKKKSSEDALTCISIVIRKDGTPTTKCIYSAQPDRTPRRRRASSSSSLLLPTPPNKRRLIFQFPNFHNNKRTVSRCNAPLSARKGIPDKLQCLPLELLQHILYFLDLRSLLTMRTVSRQFDRLCGRENHDVWRALFSCDFFPLICNLEDPYQSYVDHHELNRRWRAGEARTSYLKGHTDSVYCLAWVGPHHIVSGSRDKTIKLWDLRKPGHCIKTERQHQGSVLCLHATDRYLISGSSDTTCLIWSLPDCRPLRRLEGHTGGVLDLCVVDGWIVTSSRDSTIRVWDQESGQEQRRLVGHSGPVNALEAYGSKVISASGDTTLKLWDVATGQCLRTFVGHTRGLACVKYNGKWIYSGGQDGIRVWDAETGECLITLGGHTDLIRTIDCYGDKIVSGSYDRTLRVWDAKTGECLMRCQSGHSSWIFNVLMSSTRIVSASQDRRIMVLDFAYNLHSLA